MEIHESKDFPVCSSGGSESSMSPQLDCVTSRAEKTSYQTSPHAPNIPENNCCRPITYRGSQVASFTVNGKELICLPQAFELFLKHLVGGLHTVYTKLKRLEITPVVCNVEQVRILRGVAAIQPGVNRCKLISPQEFDILYEDCTSSSARPGRPPKRSSFVPELADIPTKMKKTLEPPSFSFNDMKPHSTSVPPIMAALPAYQNSLPTLPLMSPYQINFMHQAAVQMALANQLHSNMSRHADADALLTCSFSKADIPALSSQPKKASPHIDHRSPIRLLEAEKFDHNLNLGEEKRGGGGWKTCRQIENQVVVSSPQHTIPTPPLSSPTTQTGTDTEPTYMNGGREAGKPLVGKRQTDRQTENGDVDVESLPGSSSPSRWGDLHTHMKREASKHQLDDLLSTIRQEVQSFIDSIVQHQSSMLNHIDSLRRGLNANFDDVKMNDRVKEASDDARKILESHSQFEGSRQMHMEKLLKLTQSNLNRTSLLSKR